LFGECLSEAQIPDFDLHLGEAVNEFIRFVEEAGGLTQYFPR